MVEEHEFTCPYCWQPIAMVLDLSVETQEYVEDCEVCCRPILVRVEALDGELTGFTAEILE